jgi:hypothetical protein
MVVVVAEPVLGIMKESITQSAMAIAVKEARAVVPLPGRSFLLKVRISTLKRLRKEFMVMRDG